MQGKKKYRIFVLIGFIILISSNSFSQEIDTIQNKSVIDSSSVEKNKKIKLFNIFKKKKKEDENIEDDLSLEEDSLEETEKKGFFSFLKRKNKQSSGETDSIEVIADSIQDKNKFSLFNRNDSTNKSNSLSKPQRLSLSVWKNMNATQQDSILKVWDEYDRGHYKKKKRYSFTRKEVKIALSPERNLYERMIYKRARNKPFKLRKKLINSKNSRLRKVIAYDHLSKKNAKNIDPADSTQNEKERYKLINNKFKIQAKREIIRKNKVIVKYDRKEDRLRRKYELNGEEKKALNKARGMRLKGAELILFRKAKRKQEKFTEELIEMRKERSFALQNKDVQQKMKKKNKVLQKRDKDNYGHLTKKKKKRKDEKFDSSEYPKRYHK